MKNGGFSAENIEKIEVFLKMFPRNCISSSSYRTGIQRSALKIEC